MNRGIITISEPGAVMMPDVPVWMTFPEIVDLLGVFECDVRRTVKSILSVACFRYPVAKIGVQLLRNARSGRQDRSGYNLPPTERIPSENLAPVNGTPKRHPATGTSDGKKISILSQFCQ